ncbi:O-antigen ligase family protein [Microbulbifer sp. MCCC 1A16149]|uniref:O-antigen ligase family protein n=1 Tax=Microbulbifer sp. MCCC 1A16149 TaxID=3411322 RepID=UPI003D09E338
MTEAVGGMWGKYLLLAAGALTIFFAALYTLLRLGITKQFTRIMMISVIVIFPLETIIFFRQPALESLSMIAFRVACYLLAILGFYFGRISFRQSRVSECIYDFLIPLTVTLGSLLYFKSLASVAHYARGRITVGDDISSVGLSFSLCLLGVICFSQAVTRVRVAARVLNIFAAIAVLPPVIVSASRGGLAAYFLTSLLVLVVQVYSDRKNFRKLLVYALLGLVSVFVMSYVLAQNALIKEQFVNLVDRFLRVSDGDDQSTNARSIIVSYYFEHFWDFVFLGFPGYAGPYPHNLLLDFFVRFGLYGLLLVVFIYLRSFLVIFRFKNVIREPVLVLISSVTIFSFLNAQMSMTAEFLRFYWFCLAYVTSHFLLKYRSPSVISSDV